jgi:polysaccharide export outer membrane protein
MVNVIALLMVAAVCAARQDLGQRSSDRVDLAPAKPDTSAQVISADKLEPGYILGSGDEITVRVVNMTEISDKPISIDLSGDIRFPMVGLIHASGLTAEQLASAISKRLETYVKQPDVSVSIAEFRSQPVSILGAVNRPGVQQVQGQKTLLEMLSLAGGIDSKTAGPILKITRRLEFGPLPLPNATPDPTHQFSVAQVSLKSLLEAKTPEENISIKPYDVISVPQGEMVYVIGEVPKPGGFIIGDTQPVTVLQALSMAGGADKLAQPQHARILRRVAGGTSRTEIAVNIDKMLEGKSEDIRLQAEDILFVPNSIPKRAALRAVEAAVQAGIGAAIFRP